MHGISGSRGRRVGPRSAVTGVEGTCSVIEGAAIPARYRGVGQALFAAGDAGMIGTKGLR
jgi:hypothetical protein